MNERNERYNFLLIEYETKEKELQLELAYKDITLKHRMLIIYIAISVCGQKSFFWNIIELLPRAFVESKNPIKVTIYPNPTNSILKIVENEIFSIEIYNISGQLLLSAMNIMELDVSILPEGFYNCKIQYKRSKYNVNYG